jgi:site-specific DNA-cytosine methylase
MITHASIIPLIGGEVLGSEKAFGSRPDYILSYDAFHENETHLLNYWNHEVPYYILDEGDRHPHSVDVVSSVCPCAGLSQFSMHFGEDNKNNRWLIETAKYVLGEIKPLVFWGENAPAFPGKIGEPIRNQMIAIGKEHGYTFSMYKTKSLLHGVPQTRARTFYFFWKGDRVPVFNYYNRQYQSIEDLILSVENRPDDPMSEVINSRHKPSEDPYYRYILEEIHGGISHREYFESIDVDAPSTPNCLDVYSIIESHKHDYSRVSKWMEKNGYERQAQRCIRMYDKLESGGNIMRRGTILPKGHIGSFVGHYPTVLTHPVEDRYVTYREGLSIMGMPTDFQLLKPKANYNHICQNVPVQTATDMATEVKASLEGKRDWIDAQITIQHNTNQTMEIWEEKIATLEAFF